MLSVITDPHVGNHRRFGGAVLNGLNERALMTLDAVHGAYIAAQAAGSTNMLIGGDLFDCDKPSPAMIAAVQRVTSDLSTAAIVGNHDRTSPGEHALMPIDRGRFCAMSAAACFRVSDAVISAIPATKAAVGCSLVESYERELYSLVRPSTSYSYLIVHSGIIDSSTPPFLRDETHAVPVNDMFDLMDTFGIHVAVCGDWHEHKVWTRKSAGCERAVIQLGALVPTGFDNPGLDSYGRILHLPSSASDPPYYIQEIAGPRFLNLSYEEELDALVAGTALSASNHTVYLAVRVLPENAKHARKDLEKLVSAGMIKDFSLTLSKEFVAAQTQTAAKRARSASSFYDALDAYLKATPLPEGVSREGVTHKIRELVSQSALAAH